MSLCLLDGIFLPGSDIITRSSEAAASSEMTGLLDLSTIGNGSYCGMALISLVVVGTKTLLRSKMRLTEKKQIMTN